ncbi:MAG TPA: cation diffusion facilitator family transporter [Pseudobdellovibrionaceae bacterium]|nr:cation diffusion facilitator family transporter [Pseudobdellovibrionaceae bacterium]
MSNSNSDSKLPHHSCDHDHEHSHDHDHGGLFHHHGPTETGTSSDSLSGLKWAFAINLVFALIELVGGIWSNSVAVISDSIHDFGDAFSILLMLGFEKFSQKKNDEKYSYGYQRFSVFGAMVGGGIIFLSSLLVIAHSIPRLLNPEMPDLNGMLLFSVFGMLANGYAAFKLVKGKKLIDQMLLWHLIEDVMSWVVVFFAAIVLRFVNFPQLDALLGIALSILILYQVFKRLKQAFQILMMANPKNISIAKIQQMIQEMPQVKETHHCHLWTLDGVSNILTCHVVVAQSLDIKSVEDLKKEIKLALRKESISEATIEIEYESFPCEDPQH